ncbi:MAG: hypothetical protein JWQ90_1274 [Hydrocarboniphaga sp.]|uniref:GIY-YIG nuclease family protein n=1 Tax=Hydrocarboniphaga sp. TaxID=2033016 RepID=UPI0026058292|nr:GIY-YIG nuclease family protein [Hydrocarboniphaga sp.]MDB5968824.1 hypothetical protein [Hydrocarboniphaga sp.]
MRGYVYALINPSMPDVVKVGHTTRNPDERAKELSSVTGVPTPFMVGYSIEVSDCVVAEQRAHQLLTQKALRVSGNREFFRVPFQEVVKVLIRLETLFPLIDATNFGNSGESRLAENATLKVDSWLSAESSGLFAGSIPLGKNSCIGSMVLTPNVDFILKKAIQAGDPPEYRFTTDGLTCTAGGSWDDAQRQMRRLNNKASAYPCVDFAITLLENLLGPMGDVVANIGERLGHTTHPEGWYDWETFYKKAEDSGLVNAKVKIELGCRTVSHRTRKYSVATVKLLGAA